MSLEPGFAFQIPLHVGSEAAQEHRILEIEAERHSKLKARVAPGGRGFAGEGAEAKEQKDGESGRSG